MDRIYLSILTTIILCAGLLTLNSCSGDDEYVIVTPSIVNVEVVGFDSDSATVLFTPNENTSKFIFAIGDASDRTKFVAGELEGTQTSEGNSEKEYTFEGLDADVAYTVFAAGYNKEGVLQAVQSVIIVTSDTGIRVKTNFVAVNTAAVEVNMPFDVARYDWALYEGREVSEENRLAGENGLSEIYRFVYTFFDLKPTTDYVFVVTSTMRNRGVYTNTVSFSTKEDGEVPAVDFNILHSDVYWEEYEVRPANDLTGAIAVMYQTAGYMDSNIMSPFAGQGDFAGRIWLWGQNNVYPGTYFSVKDGLIFNETNSTFQIGIDREVYAVACDLQGNIANLQKFSFQNVEYDANAGVAEVGIEILNIQRNSVEYHYTPNEHTIGFFVQTFEAELFEQEYLPQLATNPGVIHDFLLNNYGVTYMIYPRLNTDNWIDTTVESGSDYYAVAAAFNANGTLGWGNVTYEKFSTPQ